jgi:hypothetical protein
MKSKGKRQIAKGKRAALDFRNSEEGAASEQCFCILMFAF